MSVPTTEALTPEQEARVRRRDEHATLAMFEEHTLHDAHDCWRCAMVDRRRLLATLDEARATAPAGLDALLPTFEVGQVVGELQPGRRRHDWCSMHGDIGPMESIDAHARRAHGSSAEAIRKARKVIKRAVRAALAADSEHVR